MTGMTIHVIGKLLSEAYKDAVEEERDTREMLDLEREAGYSPGEIRSRERRWKRAVADLREIEVAYNEFTHVNYHVDSTVDHTLWMLERNLDVKEDQK